MGRRINWLSLKPVVRGKPYKLNEMIDKNTPKSRV
ncbi:MAG: hypothetical protein Ct9H90mP22_4830 [Gammaproteobacteria bacterium]|nr:MAG: hypothetical protein Ct9H90mP22_4830 [Gammaproteobacteria bacterium]